MNHFDFNELRQFTGSEYFFKHWGNSKMVYTEGVKYLAEKASCFWLIDEIALVLLPKLLHDYEDSFFYIELSVFINNSAFVIVTDGNNRIYLKHKINWTDFPVLEKPLRMYLCDSDNKYCLMLPSEY
jgi:hypothetical protein